jgi:predicted transcriptional regulator
MTPTDVSIVRLTPVDTSGQSDHYRTFRALVSRSSDQYPAIDSWLQEKVLPGIRTGERVAYVGYRAEEPVVSAVVKRGSKAKFCHLRLREDLEDANLGEVFFSLMALDTRVHARELHFTLPETLWQRKQGFFSSFGFHRAQEAEVQYRLFDRELRCTAAHDKVWAAVLEKLPKLLGIYSVAGYALGDPLLMSIREPHVSRILDGRKSIEVRKRFSPRFQGRRVVLYASGQRRALVGEATIGAVVNGPPGTIWDSFHMEIGCSRGEFDDYAGQSSQLAAIQLQNVVNYPVALPLTQIHQLTGEDLRPPQSYCAVSPNGKWGKAVSVATLLQGSFRSYARTTI